MPLTCDTCGNPVPDGQAQCPYCGHWVGLTAAPAEGGVPLREVLLKEGMPTAIEAERRLLREIEAARQGGVGVLKVIHGYGSTGKGGVLRKRVRALGRRLQRQGHLLAVVPGEDFSRRTPPGKALLRRHPALKADPDYGRQNRGITLLMLG